MILNSPGVAISETNNTITVPSVSTSSAALVGYSTKGTMARTLITSQQMFLKEYGIPTPGQYFHYSALAYLAKGNQLYCQRVAPSPLYGGVRIVASGLGTSSGIAVGAATPVHTSSSTTNTLFMIFGKDPGTWNNNISIVIAANGSSTTTFIIQVWYTNPTTSVTTNVENWTVSRNQQLDGFGNQQFLETVINGYSSYIVVSDSGQAGSVMPQTNSTAVAMLSGSNGTALASWATRDNDIAAGWSNNFANVDDLDVRILINGGETGVATQSAMTTLSTGRVDCVAILDIPLASVTTTTAMTTWKTTTAVGYINNTYTTTQGPWISDEDNYNGVLVTLPPSGYVAGCWANNDNVAQVWDAPAGDNRGQLPVIGCAGMSTAYPNSILDQGDRDVLVAAQINPIQNFRGYGIELFEQKTCASQLSDLSSINVRRSLIVIEKALKLALRGFLFERNNNVTRLNVKATISQYLSRIAALGAFDQSFGPGWAVVCDLTNNSPAQIQNLELHVDIYVQPILAVEKLYANVILTPTGATLTSFASGQLI